MAYKIAIKLCRETVLSKIIESNIKDQDCKKHTAKESYLLQNFKKDSFFGPRKILDKCFSHF